MSEPFSEADEITGFVAQLPSARLETAEAYPRGTVLTLNVQVRVKNAYTDEDRKGNLFIRHNLVIDEASIIDVLTPAQRKALIEAAEQEAVREFTVQEEDTIEDVMPGQTTIDDALAEETTTVEDDNDPEHAWMDEEEEFVHGVRVEVG